MIGAGFMAQGLANQIENSVPGMSLVGDLRAQARARRRRLRLRRASTDTRRRERRRMRSRTAIATARPVVTEDPLALCRAEQIDVVVDVTGSVEFGSQVALEAFEHGKHVVAMNAEVDATIGPILHVYAAGTASCSRRATETSRACR